MRRVEEEEAPFARPSELDLRTIEAADDLPSLLEDVLIQPTVERINRFPCAVVSSKHFRPDRFPWSGQRLLSEAAANFEQRCCL